MTANKII